MSGPRLSDPIARLCGSQPAGPDALPLELPISAPVEAVLFGKASAHAGGAAKRRQTATRIAAKTR